MMHRIQFNPKTVSEARTETIDLTGVIPNNAVLGSATASCAVYSGSDPIPYAILGTPVVNVPYGTVSLPLFAAGVSGTIYSITITALLSTGNSVRVSGFLVVIPDPV